MVGSVLLYDTASCLGRQGVPSPGSGPHSLFSEVLFKLELPCLLGLAREGVTDTAPGKDVLLQDNTGSIGGHC